MGIGRRDFLKLFGASLATLALTASPAVAILDEYYVNRKLGIAFKRYAGWHFANVADMGEIADGQILDLEDERLGKYIREITDLPILTITKESLSIKGSEFTPGINIWLDQYTADSSTSQARVNSLDRMIKADIEVNTRILKEFSVLSEPINQMVSGCEAIAYSSSFIFEHEKLAVPTRVRMKALIVAQNSTLYIIRMYDSPFHGQDVDYTEFLDSIYIV